MPIGVVGLQGNFAEHIERFKELDVAVKLVKKPEDLEHLDGLIIPGGESTAIGKMMKATGLNVAVKNFNKPIWGTCAGAILLAKEVETKIPVDNLDLIDIKVSRNAYGNQLESFETELNLNDFSFLASFIRAPRIVSAEEDAEVVCRFDGEPVLVRQGNILVSTFHTELYSGSEFYEWLMSNFFEI